MSRGIIIIIVVLCGVLAALLFLPKFIGDGGTTPPPVVVTTPVEPVAPAPQPTANPPRPAVAAPAVPAVAPSNTAAMASAAVHAANQNAVNPPESPDDTPLAKPLPTLERDYTATTNQDTRIDIIMEIAERPGAESVKTLTRLFQIERDQQLLVDMVDSLLAIEGHKDEKLVLLGLAVRQGMPNEVRQSAIDGLIDLEDQRVVGLLNGLLNDPDPEIREGAQDALELVQLPPQELPRNKLK
jgi:hypothetical protein